MNIVTKFDIGQTVFWKDTVVHDFFTFSKGVISEIKISPQKIFYKIEYTPYGQPRTELKCEDKLYASYEEMALTVLRERQKYLQDLLDKTNKEITEYEKKGI